MKTYFLVHADGGDCHGTPLVSGTCPVCRISPDMQSTEFWREDEINKQNFDPLAVGLHRVMRDG